MKKPAWNDSTLITALKGNELVRAKAFEHLFANSGWEHKTIRRIRRLGGSRQDGEEVFSEALYCFDRNIRDDKYRGEGSLEAYFMRIAHNIWLQLWQSSVRRQRLLFADNPDATTPVQHAAAEDAEIMAWYHQEELRALLFNTLGQLGKNCRRIFELTVLGYSHQEIAGELGLANAEQAKKAKHRCVESGRAFLRDHPEWKQFFKK